MPRGMAAGGGAVIGNFHYCSEPQAAAVNVEMVWRDSARVGSVMVGPVLRSLLAMRDYPALDAEEMSLDSALAYALFIALRAEIPLVLTGDRSVWPARWGQLLPPLDSAPPQAAGKGRATH